MHPSDLPRPWACRSVRDPDTILVWRRPAAAYRWVVLATVTMAVCLVLCGWMVAAMHDVPMAVMVPLSMVSFAALVLLVRWLDTAMETFGTGWLVRTGRLDFTNVGVRTGDEWPGSRQRRVVALDLVRHLPSGYVRLDAILENENREVVMSGRRDRHTIAGFARWLAELADVPLREAGRD
jgi:multisubunit Na+/H+ antiporter MnhF subunit